jgi:hypothetical protein
VTGSGWREWHDEYDRRGSPLARRLAAVQEQIHAALDKAPPGPLHAISLCAGQGRDLLGALADHPRRPDVAARLVELDPGLAADARRLAAATGMSHVDIRVGDAGLVDQYTGLVPADLVLVCGVFGNISDGDVERTIACCAGLCATGGIVVWTRHREPPDLVPQVCEWFAGHGFALRWLSDPAEPFGLGVHRYTGEPRPLAPGTRMFTFVGEGPAGRDRPTGPSAVDEAT